MLGTSYTDLNVTLERIEHAPGDAYNAGITSNVPFAPYADLRFTYDYWWYNSGGNKSHYHLATAESRFIQSRRGVKPFAGLLLGYQWSRDNYNGYGPPLSPPTTTTPPGGTTITTPIPGGYTTTTVTSGYTYTSTNTRENNLVWGLSGGVEVPVGRVAFTPHVAYFDPMVTGSKWTYEYGVEAHHWFNETVGAYADVTYHDFHREPNSWWYTAGVRVKY